MANPAPKIYVPGVARKTKQREKDPVKLVMARGLNEEKRRVPILDEDGNQVGGYERRIASAPKGVVLGPVQTLVLAKYIASINFQVQQLDALLAAALADDADEDAEDEAEQVEASA